MVALRPIKAGEEVLNYYGPLPSSDLLRRYGYFSEKHTVHDVAEVEWALVIKATVNHLGMSELEMKQAVSRFFVARHWLLLTAPRWNISTPKT